ncbi:EF-hand domain-containing protein [Shewanella oncorhynchi]|uniref:EF-hand domain-containing protein n=1 Tax=Shewanella oncorhynchi TaxID=2726434 RepID=UPI003D795775
MDKLQKLFDFFDRNSDGYLSKKELIELVEVLLNEKGLGKSSQILKEYDFNQDNKIDFHEFKEFAKTL